MLLTTEHTESAEMSELSDKIIGAAIEAHGELGHGLPKNTYEVCLNHELILQDIKVVRQKKKPVQYNGLEIDEAH